MFTPFTSNTATNQLIPGIHACTIVGNVSFYYAFWIPILSFEFISLALVLIYGFRTLFQLKTWGLSRLSKIVVRDNVLYFLM